MLTELTKELLCVSVEPSKVYSPKVRPEHTQPVVDFDNQVVFALGIPPAVEVPLSETSRVDCFVDNLILSFLATPNNLCWAYHAVLLAVHLMSQPHARRDKPIPWRQLLEPDKLEANGCPQNCSSS